MQTIWQVKVFNRSNENDHIHRLFYFANHHDAIDSMCDYIKGFGRVEDVDANMRLIVAHDLKGHVWAIAEQLDIELLDHPIDFNKGKAS